MLLGTPFWVVVLGHHRTRFPDGSGVLMLERIHQHPGHAAVQHPPLLGPGGVPEPAVEALPDPGGNRLATWSRAA